MAIKHRKLLSYLLCFSILLHFPACSTSQECQYPCYPPPAGSRNNPPGTTATQPPAAAGSFSPPAFGYYPPAGVFPYFPPPRFNGLAPPPPDPVVPWYPYYSRNPPRGNQSSSTASVESRTMINTAVALLVFIMLFLCFY